MSIAQHAAEFAVSFVAHKVVRHTTAYGGTMRKVGNVGLMGAGIGYAMTASDSPVASAIALGAGRFAEWGQYATGRMARMAKGDKATQDQYLNEVAIDLANRGMSEEYITSVIDALRGNFQAAAEL